MKNKYLTQRKTKILATLGPSTNTIKKIMELSKAGANAFRLNCSHLNEDSLRDYVKKIRRVEKLLNKPIGIFGISSFRFVAISHFSGLPIAVLILKAPWLLELC